jgi:hypothetical protein
VDRVKEETDTVPVDQFQLWLDYVAAVNTINSQTEAGRDDLAAECLGTAPGPDGVAELPRGYGDGNGYGNGYGDGYGDGDGPL